MSAHWAIRSRMIIWIGLFTAAIGWAGVVLRGQEEPTDEPIIDRERLVLFKSGRMETGRVSRNAGGYLIEKQNGRIQVPEDEVKFVVDNLHDAYRKQRDSIVEPTPATHVALAKWCITYQLYDDAREELKRCLNSDPENVDARRLLQRLTDTIRAGLPKAAEPPISRKTLEGFSAPKPASLGGLSPELAIQFKRVENILVNKCGNASCHGVTSSNDFKIISSRVGGRSRENTQRNLAEVMKQIDLDDVGQSRLLEALRGSHGGGRPIFTGQAASEQIKTIRNWVRQVADEKQIEKEEFENRPSVTRKGRSKSRDAVASAKPDDDEPEVKTKPTSKFDPEVEQVQAKSESAFGEPRKIESFDAVELANEPEDAFDPEVFNKLAAPRNRSAEKVRR